MTPFRFNLMRGLIYTELRLRGYKIEEGSSSPRELQYLYEVAKRSYIKRIAEIGFHLGFSSYAFLKANPKVSVTSFDIGSHSFIPAAKNIIDRKFPNRHTIIYGDSTKIIPEFAKMNPNIEFDLIFIDGGHDYETAKADIQNMKLLAHSGTIVVIDDLTPWLLWGKGPTRAWQEAIDLGLVAQKEIYKDGRLVKKIEPPGERSWAMGYYKF